MVLVTLYYATSGFFSHSCDQAYSAMDFDYLKSIIHVTNWEVLVSLDFSKFLTLQDNSCS